MYDGFPQLPSGDGSSETPQEHELDARWPVLLLVGVGGLFLGLSLFTGLLCWIRGRWLRKGYQALGLPVPQGAAAVESIGLVSFVLTVLAIPIAIAYLP
ncbi:MAG: hypothetical protein KDK70_43240 [Myxococcales bacterium]|nr:hypothetical protein [Myxococcales bacterium]